MINLLSIFGTRPEAIKMEPALNNFEQHPQNEPISKQKAFQPKANFQREAVPSIHAVDSFHPKDKIVALNVLNDPNVLPRLPCSIPQDSAAYLHRACPVQFRRTAQRIYTGPAQWNPKAISSGWHSCSDSVTDFTGVPSENWPPISSWQTAL